MPRLSEGKHIELKAFLRAHIQGQHYGTLNQTNYCEALGPLLKRSENWREGFRHEDPRQTGTLLWRSGGVADNRKCNDQAFERGIVVLKVPIDEF